MWKIGVKMPSKEGGNFQHLRLLTIKCADVPSAYCAQYIEHRCISVIPAKTAFNSDLDILQRERYSKR